jgi:DNA-binding CsgD family transcriptional regulator
VKSPPNKNARASAIDVSKEAKQPVELSRRQTEILKLLAEGLSNKQIASHLSVAPGTVKQHVYTLYRKLGVTNRTSAALHTWDSRTKPWSQTRAFEVAAQAPYDRARGLHGGKHAGFARMALLFVVTVTPQGGGQAATARRHALQTEALRRFAETLAISLDGRLVPLPAGSVAVHFGVPVSHPDDAERAVSFARSIARWSATTGHERPVGLGIASGVEFLDDEPASALLSDVFRRSNALSHAASAHETLVCVHTAQAAGVRGVSVVPQSGKRLPECGGRLAATDLAVKEPGRGLPFMSLLMEPLKRQVAQWVCVEAWPPALGKRVLDVLSQALRQHETPVAVAHIRAPADPRRFEKTLLDGLVELSSALKIELPATRSVTRIIETLAARGPLAVLLYGHNSLDWLKAALGSASIARLAKLPVLWVGCAVPSLGHGGIAVRILGDRPERPLLGRVYKLPQVPAPKTCGTYPDVLAVLDTLSADAKALARLASVEPSNVERLGTELDLPRVDVWMRLQELSNAGIAYLAGEAVQFRDAETEGIVKALFHPTTATATAAVVA